MSRLIGKGTRLIVQGMTGKQGTKISQEMIDYGTTVVAGVTPGRGGAVVNGVPVHNTVSEALRAHPDANTSLITVPRDSARDAAFEAIGSSAIKLVNVLTEGLPWRDAAEIVQFADDRGVRVVGPASIGLINPIERVKVGAIGGNDPGVFYPGHIAIFSKSGGMCLSIATDIFNKLGLGTSLVVGVGGDRITGTTFRDLLEIVREDPDTALIVLNGEVGGSYEEEAAAYIQETDYPKPVIARLTGIGAERLFPRGSRMGHAGAIIGEGSYGTYQHKIEAFESANVPVAKTAEELIEYVQAAFPARGEDLDQAVSEEIELVSVSKPKLENMKSQIRAVQIRTSLTHLSDGTPYFRGYPLSDLIRNASVPEMVYMALMRQDATHERAFQLGRDFVYCAQQFAPPESALAAASWAGRESGPLQVAVVSGLTAMPDPDLSALPREMSRRYTPEQAGAIALAPQTINLVGHLLGNSAGWETQKRIESAAFAAVAGREPDIRERDVLRAIYIACLDHTPATPSSLAAVSCYSGGNSLKTALAAGVATMGETHAGAGEGAAKVLREFMEPFRKAREKSEPFEADGVRMASLSELAAYMVDKITGVYGGEKRRIPGYGHRYYSQFGVDPRAEALFEIAEELGVAGECCALAKAVESSLRDKKAPGLCINVDGVIGALLCDMGLPAAAGKALFIMPRTIGILAQLLEQRQGSFFRLSNDSIIYTGPEEGGARRFE